MLSRERLILNNGPSDVQVGCCGWAEGRARYFTHFPLVEIQTTFYEPPAIALAGKWRREAPAEFQFWIKAWQLITHTASSPTYRRLKTDLSDEQRAAAGAFRATGIVDTAWERTLAIANALDAKGIVFQCPASFLPTPENVHNLRSFFGRVEREDRMFAWEPRGGAWPAELIRALCEELDLLHCVDPFVNVSLHGSPVYLRLHGGRNYRYRYTDDDLKRLLGMTTAGSQPAYVLFNNFSMKQDALRFQELLCDTTKE